MWDHRGSGVMKRGHFVSDFTLPVAPWFGAGFRDLAFRLYQFFGSRRKCLGKPLTELDPKKDYDDFLFQIQQCIADIETANDRADTCSFTPGHDSLADQAIYKQTQDPFKGQELSTAQPLTRKRTLPGLPAGRSAPISRKRPRRDTVNYGDPI